MTIASHWLCTVEFKHHFGKPSSNDKIYMNRILHFLLFLIVSQVSMAQTPVPMALQPGLTYTENFADIANWGNGFTSGIGAERFAVVPVLNTGTIPSPGKTTVSSATFSSAGSGGIQKGTENIYLLSTGTTDNTSAVAFDLLLDFANVEAGAISFDWASVNNSSGDRKGSLRIYASIDGTTFTEITNAAVLNFTNSVLTSGSVTSIDLPSIFDFSSTAILRFYYHNGSGGSTGSRPKISIDNISVTAIANNPCTTPALQPTSIIFSNITSSSVQGNFTSAPGADQYLTIASTNNSLTSNPVDGQNYLPGDGLGDGFVVANSNTTAYIATGLAASTTYYFFTFSMNAICSGGPKYLSAAPLNGIAVTTAGFPPCVSPASQPSNLVYSFVGINSISATFTATAADKYLILRSTASSLTQSPVNGQLYNPGDLLGNASVVQLGSSQSFNANGLSANTAYYFFIFSANDQLCSNGPVYNFVTPLSGMQVTMPLPVCASPTSQPTFLVLNPANNAISGSFSASTSADDYLVIRSTSPTLSANPVNNTDYVTGNNIGGGVVIANNNATNFTSNNLNPATTYYYFVYAANKNCTGGTKYLMTNSLKGNATTTNTAPNNYYFGTLHSHSDYSDGNKDNPGFTPADNYNYALTSQCMDFLGISEHNHFSSPGNPGNLLSNYHAGINQANSFNATHPNFVALYGMEWGVISGGGHALLYGDGMNDLLGWESGSGGWGSSNNYDVYVPKNTYTGNTGLFKVINDRVALNTFASLAHPNFSDYNNLANIGYDAVADNAISATAVESGPATSTNTTYSNAGSSMSYLWYYQLMLSKGYHLGPVIDHDNHNTTFGRTTYSRTAVIAPSLSRTNLVKAMRDMNFYATQDCDSKVDFTINAKIMGSIFTDRYAPIISVNISDATTTTSSAVIRIMFGIPGSGSLPVKIDSAIGNSLNFSDHNLANLSTGYYYADISNGSSRIVTSPIWYTRNDFVVLPVTLASFAAKKFNNVVQLNWVTSQETNSSHFIIERSFDGTNWNAIATVAASGNSNVAVNYEAFDNTPVNGANYYRIKQVDPDGSFKFSEVRNVVFKRPVNISVTPNPASEFIKISGNSNTKLEIDIVDMQGKKVIAQRSSGNNTIIHISHLSKGIYLVKLTGDNVSVIEKIIIH